MKRTKFRSKFEGSIASQILAMVPSRRVKYESSKLPYVIESIYNPDFEVKLDDKTTLYIEAKGYFDAAARRKMAAVKEQHPDKRIVIVFQADRKLSKGSKMTYSQWAEKHGFEYSIGFVPEDWLKNNNE